VVSASKPTDWRASVVPTFMYRVVPVRATGGGTADFELQEHSTLLSFTQDVRFGLAWGLVAEKNYSEDWIDKLPNKRAQGVILDFLYNGTLVFRDTLVAVDGWRCILPQPINETARTGRINRQRIPHKSKDLILHFLTNLCRSMFRTEDSIIALEWCICQMFLAMYSQRCLHYTTTLLRLLPQAYQVNENRRSKCI